MKIIFITIILFCSCHSYSFRKGEKDETDSIRLQKDDNLYMLFVF